MNVLAHYAIYIGERLALIHRDANKTALLESAHCQWVHQPQFEWVKWESLINTGIDIKNLMSETSGLLGPTPMIGAVKTNIGHLEQSSNSLRLVDLLPDSQRVLEAYNSYQRCSRDHFDISRGEDYHDGATDILGVTNTTSTKAYTPGIGHQDFFSLDEESTLLRSEIIDKQVESRCNSCGVHHSVESSSSHDGWCKDCSTSYDLGLHYSDMDDIMNDGQTLHGADRQTPGAWIPQGLALDPASDSMHDMLDINAKPANSRDNTIAPGVLEDWFSEGWDMTPGTPGSFGQSSVKPRTGEGKYVTGLPLYSSPGHSTDETLALETIDDPPSKTETTAIPRRASRIPGKVYDAAGSDDFADRGRPRPSNLPCTSHSIVRSYAPPEDADFYRLLV